MAGLSTKRRAQRRRRGASPKQRGEPRSAGQPAAKRTGLTSRIYFVTASSSLQNAARGPTAQSRGAPRSIFALMSITPGTPVNSSGSIFSAQTSFFPFATK